MPIFLQVRVFAQRIKIIFIQLYLVSSEKLTEFIGEDPQNHLKDLQRSAPKPHHPIA